MTKVLFQSRKTLFDAPGGDTTQILKTKEYLEKLGIKVDISLELEPDLNGYDIVHVFNLMRPQELSLQIKNAKLHNKKIALSTIYGPYVEYEKKARGGVLQVLNRFLSISQIEYLKVVARAVLNKEINKGTINYLLKGHSNLQKEIIKNVDVFLPNSHSEMRRVESDFGLQNLDYISVPNAVDITKFDYDSVTIDPKNLQYKDCVLCVSRIEGRKNQLNIVRAVKDLSVKVVFIGKPGPNFHKYYKQCQEESNGNVVFLGQIDHEELPQFYKLSKVHILASWMETPGLSSLEAAAMKSNIVVTKKGDTEDYFKDFAYYCEPDDVNSIREAIKKGLNAPFNEDFLKLIKEEYSWEKTALATIQGYEKALNIKLI